LPYAFFTCVNKEQAHARTTDPSTGHNAALRVRKTEDCAFVEANLRGFQKRRKTPLEITAPEYRTRRIAAGDSTVRADSRRRRMLDLLKLGILQDTGKRRGGSRVLTLTPSASVVA
jgi:hypothetical protein